MGIFTVKWTESGTMREHEVQNVHSMVDAVWFTALEQVEDPTNAKLVDVIREA